MHKMYIYCCSQQKAWAPHIFCPKTQIIFLFLIVTAAASVSNSNDKTYIHKQAFTKKILNKVSITRFLWFVTAVAAASVNNSNDKTYIHKQVPTVRGNKAKHHMFPLIWFLRQCIAMHGSLNHHHASGAGPGCRSGRPRPLARRCQWLWCPTRQRHPPPGNRPVLMTPAVGQQDTGVRQAHTHTHIQAHTHTHIQAHTHTHTYRHTHTHTYRHTHTHIQAHTHTHIQAHTHTHTGTHTHTYRHTHIHADTHTLTHVCTQAHTH